MTAATYNITAEQGATWQPVPWIYRDSNDALVNLTGYTARMHVRESYAAASALFTLTTENGGLTLGGAAGTIAPLISATSMATVDVPNTPGTPPARELVYDLELVSGTVVTRLMQGKFTITREVTR